MNISFGSVVILVPLLVSLGVHLALGCYIIDCPLAGKRRDVNADVPLIRQYTDRQCPVCGPGGRGQCVSETTCCGKTIGCYIGTPESQRCAAENFISIPCRVNGDVCGISGDGHCVAPRVCCTNGVCVRDSKCASSSTFN